MKDMNAICADEGNKAQVKGMAYVNRSQGAKDRVTAGADRADAISVGKSKTMRGALCMNKTNDATGFAGMRRMG